MSAVRELNASELNELLGAAEARLRVVDIRTAGEVAQGIIPGSEFVPMHLIPLSCDRWRDDELIVLYCRSGARSAQACLFLQQQGLNNVVNLRGGIIDWHRQGLPIEAPERVEAAV